MLHFLIQLPPVCLIQGAKAFLYGLIQFQRLFRAVFPLIPGIGPMRIGREPQQFRLFLPKSQKLQVYHSRPAVKSGFIQFQNGKKLSESNILCLPQLPVTPASALILYGKLCTQFLVGLAETMLLFQKELSLSAPQSIRALHFLYIGRVKGLRPAFHKLLLQLRKQCACPGGIIRHGSIGCGGRGILHIPAPANIQERLFPLQGLICFQQGFVSLKGQFFFSAGRNIGFQRLQLPRYPFLPHA